MNKLLATSLALSAVCAAPLALADEPLYLGATIGQRTSLVLDADGARQSGTNTPRAFTLRGGYEINDHVAIEASYTNFGKHHFASGANVTMGALSVAAKGSIAVSDNVSIFGKAGVARHTLKLAGTAGDDGSGSKARPLFGAGVAYRLNAHVALTAEVLDYGTLRTGAGELKMRQVEAGLNVKF